jgi:phosphatidylinositol alpha-1,6-mannosyltransferase
MAHTRLLFVVNDFPPMLGGESTLYHGLARHLPKQDLLILAPRSPGQSAVDKSLGIEIVRAALPPHRGTLGRIARGAVASMHIARLLLRGVGYVLCGQLLSLGVPTRILAGIARVPYAVFVHGADLLDYGHRFPWGSLSRWVLSGAAIILVNSRFTAGLVARQVPAVASRTLVLPMGVDPPTQVTPADLQELRRRYELPGGPVLLTVARLVPIKGHAAVIQALPNLLKRFPDLTYLIVGDGPHREHLERLAHDLTVRDHVVFAGAVPQDEIPAHYRLATLFVQLSGPPDAAGGIEGFGLSYLEAASFGVPSIAGRSGGVPEAVEEGTSGFLVPPDDPRAFSVAVAHLLSDVTVRNRMSDTALEWARRHTWERAACALLEGLEGAGWNRSSGAPLSERAGSVPGRLQERGHGS